MKSSPDSTDNVPAPPEQSTVILLLKDTGDTTWRMFVPTVGLLLVGNVLDERWHTKPWLLLAGVAIGVCIAALLVKQQLAKGKK